MQELYEIVIPLSLQVAVPCTGEGRSPQLGGGGWLASGRAGASLCTARLAQRVPLRRPSATTTAVHGIASWFDVLFDGSQTQRWLSTAPGLPVTHW